MHWQHARDDQFDDDLDAYGDSATDLDDETAFPQGDFSERRAGLGRDGLIEEARRVREEVDVLVGLYEQAVGTARRPRPRRQHSRTREASGASHREPGLEPRGDERRRKALLVMLLMDLL